jgi:anti-sigma B factor antagonist
MPPDEHGSTQPASRSAPPTVEVEIRSPEAAVVTLSGEHDLLTKPVLARALTRAIAHSNVLVDLTGCTFIDSSVIGELVSASRALAERQGRLELLIPSSPTIVSRVLRMTAIDAVVAIHETRSAAEASIQLRQDLTGDAAAALTEPVAVASK